LKSASDIHLNLLEQDHLDGLLGRETEKAFGRKSATAENGSFLHTLPLAHGYAGSAQLGTFPATEGQMVFVTPSLNIQCKFAPAGVSGTYLSLSGGPELSCDRFGPRHLRLVLGPAAAAHLFSVVDDEDCCEADNLLDYGMTWSEGPFTCHSAPKGLSCNREDHGFYIGKKLVVAY
jgi:hypothetical protein